MSRPDVFRIAGADGPVEIAPGEWYINTKARARRMMQNSLSSDARRVHSCLELATMGYSQEIAVTMENGKKRPLLSADIARQTGLHRREVDRSLTELEATGLAERRPINPSFPLQKGNVEIYSWAYPREPKAPDCPSAWDNPQPEWMPQSWTDPKSTISRIIKRFRITPSPDFRPTNEYIEEAERLAKNLRESEDCLVAKLRELSVAQEELSVAQPSAPEASLYLERNGKEHNNSNGHARQPAPEEPVVAVADQVLEALQEHGTTSQEAAERLLQACRKAKPGCTPSDVVEVIQSVAAGFSRGTKSRIAVLISEVPKVIRSRKPPPAPEDHSHEQLRRFAVEYVEHPDQYPDEDVQWARHYLAGKGVT